MRILTTIFYILLILVAISFAGLNSSSIPVNLYFTSIITSIPILIIVSIALGMLICLSLFIYPYWRLKSELRKLKHQFKNMEKEIKNLRAIPIQDQH